MARISIHAHPHVRYSGSYFGYAYTFNEIQRYLAQVSTPEGKLNVGLNSPKARTQIYYGSPPGAFYDHQYKIHMVQWESTQVPDSWVEILSKYDEIWTANYFGRNAFIEAGLPESMVHVFEHGIDSHIWTPMLRGQNDKIRFLHIDSGSPRKRADIAEKAFKAAFGDNPNYELTLKYSYHGLTGANWHNKDVLESRGEWNKNVRKIHETLPLDQLVSFYHFHDVLIYPSEGEGFGMIPLQAIATGMPVISTALWCSYSDLFPDTQIESALGQSDIVENYPRPGMVVIPDLDSTINIMKTVASDILSYAAKGMSYVNDAIRKYSWAQQCQNVIDGLIGRKGNEILGAYIGYLDK